jgi:uroporphyrinogen decarboxylase
MTPRQRVLASLNHQQPDRVPIDLSGHRSSGIAAIAYAKLRKALGFPEKPIRVYDPIQQLAIVDDDVLDRFHVDTIELGRGFSLSDEYWADWTLPDGTPCQMPRWALPERQEGAWVLRAPSGRVLARMPDGAIYFEQCYWPFLENDDFDRLPEALGENMWCTIGSPPGPQESADPKTLSEGAKKLRESTDRAIIGLFGGNLLEVGQFLYRNDNFFVLLAGNPERAAEFLDRLVDIHLANLERYLAAVGPYIDVISFGDDLGSQNGPQISPRMYVEVFKPRHAKLWRRAKELANVKVMLHCCGGIRPLIPHLIEAGLDTTNPIQISCAGMNPGELKAEFGQKLAFWGGGCDTRFMLSQGTPEQIRNHVREQIEIFKPGGGFIFQQVHNILADVPPENVIALLEAAHEFG